VRRAFPANTDLRHFYASLLFAFGEGPLYVSAQMGHGGPQVTLKIYAHLMAEGRRLDRETTLARLADAARAYMVPTNRPSGEEKPNGTKAESPVPSAS
jgi:hypothetical protein